MRWSISPALLWANSFGPMMVTAAALPLWHAIICRPFKQVDTAASVGRSTSGDSAPGAVTDIFVPTHRAGLCTPWRTWQLVLLSYALGRCASLCCGVLCAAVQMHHIVVWAIFAPKVVFELCFAVSSAAACLLAAAAYQPSLAC